MAVASPEVGHVAAAIGGGSGEEAPLEDVPAVAGKEEPPAEGVPAIEVDGKEAALVEWERLVPAIAVDRMEETSEEEEEMVESEKEEVEAEDADEKEEEEDGEEEAEEEHEEEEEKEEGEEEMAEAEEEDEEDEEEEEDVKWLKHYSSMQSILIVGDGDFSFSRALAIAFCSGANLVATSLDSYEDLRGKYSKAESNILVLKIMGATILHGIDAKTMKLHADLKMRRFDRIVFNFPHAGFKGKEDHTHMINLHKELVRGFFHNASHLLRPYGETHVSHKTGLPYDKWDIEQLASESSLIMVEKVGFLKEDYPGYNQKRGDGAKCDQPFILGACCTFKFCIRDLKKLKKKKLKNVHEYRIGSISSLGGNKAHTDISATEGKPFHPLPLVPAWPWPHFPPPVNTVQMPITLEPYPIGFAQTQQPGFAVNISGAMRAPYFDQQGTIQTMFSIPGPLLNVLPTQGGIPPPMSRITGANFLAPHQQPWYQQRPILEPLGRGDYSFFAQEYQRSLQGEYEMHRQVMPRGMNSDYSVFLDHRFRESVLKKEWLEMLIAFYSRLKDR